MHSLFFVYKREREERERERERGRQADRQTDRDTRREYEGREGARVRTDLAGVLCKGIDR